METPITIVECRNYVENQFVCYSDGSPKGQCDNCGAKWYEHLPQFISDPGDQQSARAVQSHRGVNLWGHIDLMATAEVKLRADELLHRLLANTFRRRGDINAADLYMAQAVKLKLQRQSLQQNEH